MKREQEFGDLLNVGSLPELRAEIAGWRSPLTLPQAQQLAARAELLRPDATELRVAIVHTYTSDLLDPWLSLAAAVQGLKARTFHAPYGIALNEARENSQLLSFRPDLTLFLLRPEDLHPALARPIVGFERDMQARLRAEAVERLRSIVDLFRAWPVGHIVLTLLPSTRGPALGSFDAQSERSEAYWWASLRSDIGRWMREHVASSLFLDLEEVLDQVGRSRFFDLRYWYTARFPFSAEAARELGRRIINVGVLLKTPRAKVLAVDADNTLWGGVVGEEGIDGIALGPDYPGAAYVDFQRRLLDYRQRGLILALCSKNNPADVREVLTQHPHQVLREKDFAAMRVNWLTKAENLTALARELNVGLESIVFVDDSDHECAAIRHVLPQVEVIKVPARPAEIATCLDHVARLEVLSLTLEDMTKTELYAQERQRRELSEQVATHGGAADDYLRRLGMKMKVHLDPDHHVARLSQLTQKTNQFNLTTRRYDEQRMKDFVHDERWLVADFSLADVFGDSGIVGLALLRLHDQGEAELDTFLMSCRVIGREAEAAFLHAVLRYVANRGFLRIVADFVPTPKNDLARSFLADQDFEACDDGRFRRHLGSNPPLPEDRFPIVVQIEENHLALTPAGESRHSREIAATP